MKTKTIILSVLLLCGTMMWFAFRPANQAGPEPNPEPGAMTIILSNVSVLDYSDHCTYPNSECKVTFYGRRYSDGQDMYDPNSPFIMDPYYFSNPMYCYCTYFYYQYGNVNVYTRVDSNSSWVYQGSMGMVDGNCTKIGSKVTFFNVNCNYLETYGE